MNGSSVHAWPRNRVRQRVHDLLGGAAGDWAAGVQPLSWPAPLPPSGLPAGLRVDEIHLFGLPAAPGRAPVCPPREVRLVLYGVKPMALVHGEESTLAALLRWAGRHGLAGALSPLEFEPVQDTARCDYANVAGRERPAVAGSGAWRGLLLSPDPDRVALAWISLLFRWDGTLGRLLGYPVCCTEAFERRWPTAVTELQGELAMLTLQASPRAPMPWQANLFGRYAGHALLDHFPCRFDCAATRALFERAEAALARYEPEEVARLARHLRATVVCTERDGVCLLYGAEVPGGLARGAVLYAPGAVVATAPASALARAIRAHRSLAFDHADGSITVGGQRFRAQIAHFH